MAGSKNQQESGTPIVNELIDDRVFKYQVYFWNNDGRITRLPKSTINELVINDNILHWYHYGYMIFSNPKDIFERANKKYTDVEEIDLNPYRFRNDGRDYLYIELDIPVNDDVLNPESLNDETFTIKLLCSVYKVEDVENNSANEKQKKVFFWDYRQQIMTERNMMWSTAKAVKRQGYTGSTKSQYLASDDDRTVYTGDAIKDLITQGLKTEQTEPKFASDFSKGGELLFYTSPAQSKMEDDLEYLLDHHVHDSKTAEPCILRCDRFTDEWSLLPISEYYNRSHNPETNMPGEFLKDRFIIGDEANPPEVDTNALRTADNATAKENFWTDCNTINSFSFSEMSTLDANMFINTTAVHMYDTETKQFNIHIDESDIENTKQYMEDVVFKNILKDQSGLQASFVLNQTKKQNKNISHMFTATSTQVRDSLEGRNKTIMAAIMNGNSIEFTVKGMTSRQAGKFISVERGSGYNENDYDDKILGIYLTTGVSHIISTAKGYQNKVIAAKPYMFKKQDFNEDIQ